MEFLLEILLTLIVEPIMYLLVSPLEDMGQEMELKKVPKGKRVAIYALIAIFIILIVGAFIGLIIGIAMLATGKDEIEKRVGGIILGISIAVLIAYGIFVVIMLNVKKRHARHKSRLDKKAESERPDRTALRRIVHVVVDRPLGSIHPEHSDVIYGVNYGFVPDVIGGDGAAQDAYILGVDEPVSEFDGVVIAIIHRRDDEEDKWVVAPRGVEITDDEIVAKTDFQERLFDTEIVRR